MPPVNPDGDTAIYELALEGSNKILIEQHRQITLQVRYTRNHLYEADAGIAFQFIGDARDTTVSTFSDTTDAYGLAQTVLTAGDQLGTFEVEAHAANGAPVRWAVRVIENPDLAPKIPQLSGTYAVTSYFDIQTDFNGSGLGNALNVINEISNDPLDPGKYFVDRILDQVSEPAVSTAAMFFKVALYAAVNELITQSAPKLVAKLKQMGQDLSAIARRFEIRSEMVSPIDQPADQPMKVNHTLRRMAWELGGKRVEYSFAQLGMQDPVVNQVQLTPGTLPTVTISQHAFNLNYGSFLLVALNNLVIPTIFPGASSVGDVLTDQLDCAQIGKKMSSTVGVGGDGVWKSACGAAMQLVGAMLEQKVADIDKDQTVLTIGGPVQLLDQNNDLFFDRMDSGTWNGSFKLGNATANVDANKSFFIGTRIN